MRRRSLAHGARVYPLVALALARIEPFLDAEWAALLLLVLLAGGGRWLGAAIGGALPGGTWWLVLGLYALAKVMELADHWMLAATAQLAGGHMLKHMLAAAAAACLVAAVVRAAHTPSSAGGAG